MDRRTLTTIPAHIQMLTTIPARYRKYRRAGFDRAATFRWALEVPSPPLLWWEIEPKDATQIKCDGLRILGPINEMGEECPWPWDPQQLKGVPLGQYHCPYCGGMSQSKWGSPHMRGAELPEDPRREDAGSLQP